MKIFNEHLPFIALKKHCNYWVCPECGKINAWAYCDYETMITRFNTECFISHGSCFEDICGNCHASIVPCDSPLLEYQHIND